jgi:acetyl-CoA synthase
MSSILKEQMADALRAAAEREGDPDLVDKICDERIATDVEDLVKHLQEKGHPALSLPPIL